MRNILITCTVFVLFGLMLNLLVVPVLAAPTDDMQANLRPVGDQGFGEGADAGAALPARIGRIIKTALGLLGIVLVVIVIYAGALWMLAGGNEDQVKKARAWITNAIIGLIIILSAYAITDFVISKLAAVTAG